MQTLEPKTALGLYADASAVFINACLIQTDGLDILGTPISLTRPCPPDLRAALLSMRYPDDVTDAAAFQRLDGQVTTAHLNVAQELLAQVSRQIPHVDIIGYSGYTVYHNRADKTDVCLGNSDLLATRLGVPVIDHFARTDMKAGGTGSPLLSTFWEAVTRPLPKPLAVLNLGGISRLIYISELGQQYAFDIGVGCLLLDRWLERHAGIEMDFEGTWAEKGQTDERLLSYLLKTPYLQVKPPKSLDRSDFDALLDQVEGCSPADGAATLTDFIVQSIVRSIPFLPATPVQWILTGGGTLNPALMLRLKKHLSGSVNTITEIDMPHYHLDAAGYAFLAVRSLMQLPITFPETTGVAQPTTGGLYHAPQAP